MVAIHDDRHPCVRELKPSALQRIADRLSSSFLFRRSQRLWEANSKQWDLPLSKWNKLSTGVYIILKDYASGLFPPKFEDQALAYQNEIDWHISLPGFSVEQVQKSEAAKPFWEAARTTEY